MTKASIQEFSTTAASNTDIAGINVNTGWPPGNVGSAVRTLMSFLADSFIPQSVAMTGSTLSLTAAQATANSITLTGTPGTTCTVTIPANGMFGYAKNASGDGSSATLTTGSGSTLTIRSGTGVFYQCDGTNVSQPSLLTTATWQEIASYGLSGAPVQTMSLSGYSRYRVTLQGVTVNTSAAALEARFSIDGGSTWISTSYAQFGIYNNNTTATAFNQSGVALLLSLGLSTASGAVFDGTFEISPGTSSAPATMCGRASGFSSGSLWFSGTFSNTLAAGAAINALEIFPNGGTFSGTIILEGLP